MRRSIANQRLPLLIVGVVAATMLSLSGCASNSGTAASDDGGQNDSVGDDADGTDGDNAGGGGGGESGAVVGAVNVGGQSYDLNQIILCEPYVDGTLSIEFELILVGASADGTWVQVDASNGINNDYPFVGIDYSGPEGLFESFEDVTVTSSGGRASGSATVFESENDSNSMPLSFDVELPAKTTACR